MNRSDAKMIAEELHKFIRNDVRKAVTEMATAETEEYLNAKTSCCISRMEVANLIQSNT